MHQCSSSGALIPSSHGDACEITREQRTNSAASHLLVQLSLSQPLRLCRDKLAPPPDAAYGIRMTKTRAYTTQDGNEYVSAYAIGQLRRSQFNGKPTGERYFSTARPGLRRPVKHVMKGGGCHFAYIEGSGNTEASDGESLNHLLFKEALASLDHVKLRLQRLTDGKTKRWPEASIRIKKTGTEAPIIRPGATPLYADVYVEFEDDGELSIGTRWGGKLYIEVCHTHAVDAAKQVMLKALGLPVIEVTIPDIFTYKTPDDETTDEKEEEHRKMIKSFLERESGFLSGVILSDPPTRKFLATLSTQLSNENENLKKENTRLAQDLEKAAISLRDVFSKNDLQTGQISRLENSLTQNNRREKELEQNVGQRNQTISDLRHELREWKIWLSATCALFAAAFFFVVAYVFWSAPPT